MFSFAMIFTRETIAACTAGERIVPGFARNQVVAGTTIDDIVSDITQQHFVDTGPQQHVRRRSRRGTAVERSGMQAAMAHVALVLAPAVARPEPSEPAVAERRQSPTEADADSEYNRGMRARVARDWAEAVGAFRQALMLRADFADGGNTVIDQNTASNTVVTMYHTYFNQRNNVVAYARVTNTANAVDNGWAVFGQNANGILLSENPNFYAPLVRGPGNPNTIYYATDRLHRSADGGATNPVVSQAPIVTNAMSAGHTR